MANTPPGSKATRTFWAVLFVFGLVALGIGLMFFLSGPDMIVLTVIFGGAGAVMVLESLGRMMGWEK